MQMKIGYTEQMTESFSNILSELKTVGEATTRVLYFSFRIDINS